MCCVPWTPDVSAPAGLAARSAVPVPDDSTVFAAIQASYPGWRVWRTDDGLAAREGGTPPPGPHARGDTAAELLRGIEYVIRTRASHPRGPAIRLRRSEQAALGTLKAAGAAMSARAVSDASGLALTTATTALGGLRARGVVTRRRNGGVWRYALAAAKVMPP